MEESSEEPHFVCQSENCNNRCDRTHDGVCVNRYGSPRAIWNDHVGRTGRGHFFRYYDGTCEKCGDCFDKATKLLLCEIDEFLSKKVCECSVKRLNAQHLE